MSWAIDKNTKIITMHKGDTGSFWEQLRRKSGESFVQGDVAIFEVVQNKQVLIHREFDLQPDEPTDINPGNGKFLIAFRNSDTDTWTPGLVYETELKVVLNPIRGDRVVDGDCVRTVWQSSINIRPVIINV